ncbi:MAG: hypothetical protein KDE58_30140, partial [Caldilineaceae bacterium]|nr:hypothetical protein [Caldilineaceae bacterium]
WPNSKTVARPDEMLARSMKGFDDKYTYFAYGLPSQYVVSGPCGVLLFVVRGDRGRITVEGDRWREPFSIGRFFTVFAREGLGNPARDVAEQEGKMKALLQSATETPEDVDLNAVPVAGAAVFLNSDVQLTVDGPTIPVLRADQVKDYIRRKTKEVRLPGATVRALNEFLRTQATFEDAESA